MDRTIGRPKARVIRDANSRHEDRFRIAGWSYFYDSNRVNQSTRSEAGSFCSY